MRKVVDKFDDTEANPSWHVISFSGVLGKCFRQVSRECRLKFAYQRIGVLLLVLALLSNLSGCFSVPVAVTGGSVLGIEYTLSNKARTVFPNTRDDVYFSVKKALSAFKFPILRDLSSPPNKYVIKSESNKYYINIVLERVSQNATRITVDTRHKQYLVLKDKSLAASIIQEAHKYLVRN